MMPNRSTSSAYGFSSARVLICERSSAACSLEAGSVKGSRFHRRYFRYAAITSAFSSPFIINAQRTRSHRPGVACEMVPNLEKRSGYDCGHTFALGFCYENEGVILSPFHSRGSGSTARTPAVRARPAKDLDSSSCEEEQTGRDHPGASGDRQFWDGRACAPRAGY